MANGRTIGKDGWIREYGVPQSTPTHYFNSGRFYYRIKVMGHWVEGEIVEEHYDQWTLEFTDVSGKTMKITAHRGAFRRAAMKPDVLKLLETRGSLPGQPLPRDFRLNQ